MTKLRAIVLAFVMPTLAHAEGSSPIIQAVVQDHILPRYETFANEATKLADAAQSDCRVSSAPLKASFNATFDAWIGVSHLRFGPSEQDNRAFALAFWPDSRNKTPKSLTRFLVDGDPAGLSAEAYQEVSIAARGLYALEFLLFDDVVSTIGDPQYHCTLVQTVTQDIANNARAISTDWDNTYANLMMHPSESGPYRTDTEALQEAFQALYTGVEFTKDTRLGRPLGSFNKPRPKRAEAWRSGRSLRNVEVSLTSLRDLASVISADHPGLAARLDNAFIYALDIAATQDDPTFANIADVQGWFEVDTLRQSLEAVREILADELALALEVTEGFNALDGD
ncbi:imelysin family protein [Shimia thalassica]|uniref:imelysin family protein n=1 Tax=Shimia thalassica TaxID=1715693 RepID=UPI002734906B|nr:imelysin family protein [Shimia thalassica]MDP2520315.1 imelysin family protein [Shimia thalassica]